MPGDATRQVASIAAVFELRPMEQSDADDLAGWRYPEPYDFYDPAASDEELATLTEPTRFGEELFVADLDGRLAGFFRFTDEGDGALTIGLGLRPDLTGRGLGGRFLEDGLAFAERRFRPGGYRLLVVDWNVRAVRVYQRAGFRPGGTQLVPQVDGELLEFMEMRRPAAG
jgi:[ribosomal protein S18]-alanine N-acetyltransferase